MTDFNTLFAGLGGGGDGTGSRTTGNSSFLGNLFTPGAGKFTDDAAFGSRPSERNIGIFGNPTAKEAGGSGLDSSSMLALGGSLEDLFKRLNPTQQRLEQVALATGPFTGDGGAGLLGASERGPRGKSFSAEIAEFDAVNKLKDERDRIFKLLEGFSDRKPSKLNDQIEEQNKQIEELRKRV
jgi:hypothetical protein